MVCVCNKILYDVSYISALGNSAGNNGLSALLGVNL